MAALSSGEAEERNFAFNLRLFRESRGLTQEALAEAMKSSGLPLHATAIHRIENGTRHVRLSEARALANAVGATLDELTTGVDDDVARELMELISVLLNARKRLEVASTDFEQARISLKRIRDRLVHRGSETSSLTTQLTKQADLLLGLNSHSDAPPRR